MRCRTPETAAIGLGDYDPTPTLFVRGQPVHVANAVLFLASDDASYMTGENICVDGGLMAFGTWGLSAQYKDA